MRSPRPPLWRHAQPAAPHNVSRLCARQSCRAMAATSKYAPSGCSHTGPADARGALGHKGRRGRSARLLANRTNRSRIRHVLSNSSKCRRRLAPEGAQLLIGDGHLLKAQKCHSRRHRHVWVGAGRRRQAAALCHRGLGDRHARNHSREGLMTTRCSLQMAAGRQPPRHTCTPAHTCTHAHARIAQPMPVVSKGAHGLTFLRPHPARRGGQELGARHRRSLGPLDPAPRRPLPLPSTAWFATSSTTNTPASLAPPTAPPGTGGA